MAIAGLTVSVTTVVVSMTVNESVSVNVTIALYRYLFIPIVSTCVVYVSVFKPVPRATFCQVAEAAAVVVSLVNCQVTDLVRGVGKLVVPTVNVSTVPTVVVSLVGCVVIDGSLVM